MATPDPTGIGTDSRPPAAAEAGTDDGLVSIVLPVYNQADHIAAVVAGHATALAQLNCRSELILVCNACRDASVAVCGDIARRSPGVRMVELERGGWGRAVKAGLAAARGGRVGYTNSARTTPDQLATLVLRSLLEPDRVVKARRLARVGLRRLGSTLYNAEARILFGLDSPDINGTPKLFPRHFESLLTLTRDDDLIDLEFLAVCHREGYPVVEVPILAGPRHGGESTTKVRSALRMYAGAWQLWRRPGS